MKPRISIVIPAFNAAQFIAMPIASVLNIDYPKELLELIVVDDGSTDGTCEFVRSRMRESGIATVILRQENSGPSAARNRGWRAARGDWIQFLDSDDSINSRKLTFQSRLCDSNKEVAVIYSPWERVRLHDCKHEVRKQLCNPCLDGDLLVGLLQSRNFVPFASALVRRDWLQRCSGFREDLRLIEDVDLQLRLAIAGAHFLHLDTGAPVFGYHERSGSLSNSNTQDFFRACVRNAVMVESHWRTTNGQLTIAQKDVLISVYTQALRHLASAPLAEYRKLLVRLLDLQPSFLPGGSALRLLSRFFGIELVDRNADRLRRMLRR